MTRRQPSATVKEIGKRKKKEKERKKTHQGVLSEVFLFKFERVSSRVSASTKVTREMFGLFAVFFIHFFFILSSSSSSSSVHEKCRKLTSARVTQKWVRGKIVQYQYYVSLSTLPWTNASVFLTLSPRITPQMRPP